MLTAIQCSVNNPNLTIESSKFSRKFPSKSSIFHYLKIPPSPVDKGEGFGFRVSWHSGQIIGNFVNK
ncbi:MAG: hypothetical protein CM15mP47_0760 [Methanobacteriota archaeon]|nr:MAG: hypothetical protein CM15mP47_0760 [Euryarchaeota archaeon]